MLSEIKARRGDFDLSFLREMPVEEAREWLRTLPAVGPKTAACVLLFGLGMPGLPVDTHVFRVGCRLGLIEEKMGPDKAQTYLEADGAAARTTSAFTSSSSATAATPARRARLSARSARYRSSACTRTRRRQRRVYEAKAVQVPGHDRRTV